MSTLKVNTIQNTSGVTQYTAQAWVNFNGTSTVAIRASGNVSSITDNGTGRYFVNFTTAFADTNYAPVFSVGGGSQLFLSRENSDGYTKTTSGFAINTASTSGPADADMPFVGVAVFR